MANNTLPSGSNGQKSPLLRLPAKPRNRIYELSMPLGSTILVRAEETHLQTGAYRVRFFPALPSLTRVCSEIHNEWPLSQYYARNTFLLTDTVCKPKILTAFLACRGEAAAAITTLKVNIPHTSKAPPRWLMLSPSPGTSQMHGWGYSYRIRSTARRGEDGEVAIGDMASSGAP